MKTVCDKESLSYALQKVHKAVSLKNPLPILSGIKLEAEKDRIILTATDLELGICCSTTADVFEPGAFVLPAKYFTELVRRLPDLPVFIESDQFTGGVLIKYGNSEAAINSFPVEEFPEVSFPAGEVSFHMEEKILREMIGQVAFATATEESRPIYTGVLFKISNNQLQVVATDIHRLAWRSVPLDNCDGVDKELIIPGKALVELAKFIGSPDKSVEITVTENQALFSTEDTRVVTRLIDGQYPNFNMVIPKNHIARVSLESKDLLEAVGRASLLAGEGSPVVMLNIESDALVISINTEAGRVREELPFCHEGEPVQIAFNARYLVDALKAAGSGEIEIEFFGPLSPGIIRPAGNEEYFSLVLPVRLRGEQ